MLPASAFVTDTIHAREVVIDGQPVELHFRELPGVEFIKLYRIEQTGSEDAKAGAACRLVAASLCEPDGKPALTLDEALKLKTGALSALAAAARAVNEGDAGND